MKATYRPTVEALEARDHPTVIYLNVYQPGPASGWDPRSPVTLTAALGGYSILPGSLPAAGGDEVAFRDGRQTVWVPVANGVAQTSMRLHRGVNRITAKYTGGIFEAGGVFAGRDGPSPTARLTIHVR